MTWWYASRSSSVLGVVLSPRHKGAMLYPEVSEWPCDVQICLPKEGGDFERGPYRIADWGVIAQRSPTGAEVRNDEGH
jgi:hypothetical protein